MRNVLCITNDAYLMITFGIQGIRHFDNGNKAGVFKEKHRELEFTFNTCNDLSKKLTKAGHKLKFYHGDTDCWAIDLEEVSAGIGGIDDKWADDVDLFFISSHGANDDVTNNPEIVYDTEKDDWVGNGVYWRLGNKSLKWLMLATCSGIKLSNVIACIDIFHGLHGICAAYGTSYDMPGLGADLAEYLTDPYHTVADAWFAAQHTWNPFKFNHPIVICANDSYSYDNKGNLINKLSTLNLDSLTQGFPTHDIPRSKIVGLHWVWVE